MEMRTMFLVQKYFIFLIILVAICYTGTATPINKDNNTTIEQSRNQSSLANSYSELLDDVRWFFQRVEDFSLTAARLLPNVTTTAEKRTFSENGRLNFLIGLRHLFVGIKEISSTVRKSLETEHIRQFQYVVQATNTVHEALKILKTWFTNLRTLAAQLLRTYSRHLPEVLLGKCLGRYVIVAYPESPFYEYPYLLLSEIFNSISEPFTTTSDVVNSIEEEEPFDLPTTTESISPEQNEIPHHGQLDYKLAVKGRSLDNAETDFATSFFNFSDVLDENTKLLIENANEKRSWQKCFKMYTAETIVRKLKIYFLETE